MDPENRAAGRERTEDARDDHTSEKEDLECEPLSPAKKAPDQARGQEPVVQPLIRGETRGLLSERRIEAEDAVSDRRRPQEHLEDQEPKMLQGDESDEDVGCEGH